MTKTQYRQARRIIRDNGRYGLKYLRQISENVYQEFYDYIFSVVDSNDRLAERQDIVHYCIREGLDYNFRQIQ